MKPSILLAIGIALVSCRHGGEEGGLPNGSISNLVYFTKSEDGNVFYAVFPSTEWDRISTSMRPDSTIPSDGVFIRPDVKNGLWVDGVKKAIPPNGGAFYLNRSGELQDLEISPDELNRFTTNDGIGMSKLIREKNHKAEQNAAGQSATAE